MTHVHLTPAYGRDYKTMAEARQDFDDNKDFIYNNPASQWNGKPINREQIADGSDISIRFNKNKSVVGFKYEKEKV